MALSAPTGLLNTKLLHSSDGAPSVTSGSITTVDNSLLVVSLAAMSVGNSATDNYSTANSTLSGGGLTWTKRVAVNDDGTKGFNYTSLQEIWTAPVTTGASITLTWSNTLNTSGSGDATRVTLHVFYFTGHHATPTGATCSTIALSDPLGGMTLSGAPASTSTVILAREIEADATTDITATPDTSGGFTELYDVPAVSGSEGYACLQAQYRTGSTSTAVEWDDINANSIAVFGSPMGLGLEIVAAAGGAATTETEGFRFYQDDAAPGSATPLAAQDTTINIAASTKFRLRILTDTTNDLASSTRTLQYRKTGDTPWETVT